MIIFISILITVASIFILKKAGKAKRKGKRIAMKKQDLYALIGLFLVIPALPANSQEKSPQKQPKPYRLGIAAEAGINFDSLVLENSVGIIGLNTSHILQNGVMINAGGGVLLGKDHRYGGFGLLGLGYYKTLIELDKPIKKLKALGFGASLDIRLGGIGKHFSWAFLPTLHLRYNRTFYSLYIGIADTQYKTVNKIDTSLGFRMGIFLF